MRMVQDMYEDSKTVVRCSVGLTYNPQGEDMITSRIGSELVLECV